MHAERDMLHRVVVPELASHFAKRHITVDLIDLRWGINTSAEDSERENTTKILKVCFDEIERSRPFFIGFIGERYGWIPDKDIVESAVYGYNFESSERDMSITEMEMLYALGNFDAPENCLFFIRCGLSPEDIADSETREIYFSSDPEMKERTERLKSYLRRTYPDSTFDYQCRWDSERNTVCGLEELSEKLIESLSALIEREFPETSVEGGTALREEKLLQDSLLLDISQNTYGREREVEGLLDFALCDSEHSELFVCAPSGVGKSSLLAAFCEKCSERALVIPFFAGISRYSTDFTFIARYIYSVLTGEVGEEILSIPYGEMKKRLLLALCNAAAERRVVLVIDALDRFAPSKERERVDLLNEQTLPKNLKIIYSALPEFTDAFLRRGALSYELTSLSRDDVIAVASGVALRLHKELSPELLALIADKRDSLGRVVTSSPIYLVLLLELLCSFDYDDFAEIKRTESEEGVTPSVAINKYLRRTVFNTGGDVRDVIERISAKNIRALGEKYKLITALITSSEDGMSERDIIEISARTKYPVSAADFSVYRRTFRIHLAERDGGAWVFNHAIVRDAMAESVSGARLSELYSLAADRFLLLTDTEYGAVMAVRFLAKSERYFEILELPSKCHRLASSELAALMLSPSAQNILEYRSDYLFSVLSSLYSHISDTAYADTEALMKLSVSATEAILSLEWKKYARAMTLSDYYLLLGKLLLEKEDRRAASLFEISVNILTRVYPDEKKGSDRALEISRLYATREDGARAESFSAVAYKLAGELYKKDAEKHRAYFAELTYAHTERIKENPLSLRAAQRPSLLKRALTLACEARNSDLSVRCAVDYLGLSKIFTLPSLRARCHNILASSDENKLTAATIIKRELYLSRLEKPLFHTERAYSMATLALAESTEVRTTLLFAKTAEEYFYSSIISPDTDPALVKDVMQRAVGAMRKLALTTSDRTYDDLALAIIDDYRIFIASRGAKVECEGERVEKEPKARHAAKRKKDIYTSLGVKLGALGFLAYAILQVIGIDLSSLGYEANLARVVSLLVRNISESFFNILAVVMMFFGLLMLYSHEKRSYNYKTDSKSFSLLGVLMAVFFAVAAVADLIHKSSIYDPIDFEFFFYFFTLVLFYSVVYSSSITWFVAYGFSLAVNRPFANTPKLRFRQKNRYGEILKRHLCMLLFAAVPMMVFLPLKFYTPPYGADASIDMFGITPDIYSSYCYLPFVLQLLLSAAELTVSRIRLGAPKSARAPKAKTNKKALLSRLAVALFSIALILTACRVAYYPITERLFREYGYTVDGDFAYSVEDGTAQILRCYSEEKEITVPDSLGGYRVTSVAKRAFYQCKAEKITLPSGVRDIGGGAFSGAKNLKSIILPAELESIGSSAFYFCESLTDIRFSGEGRVEISNDAFAYSAVTHSEEVARNGYFMLGNNIAYVDTENISGTVVIPEGVVAIESHMFRGADKISELYLPKTLESIGRGAFEQCSSLYYVSLPEALSEIGDNAFFGCSRLYLVDNLSTLPLARGSDEYGSVAEYAMRVSEVGDALSDKTEDGFVFAKGDDGYILIAADENSPCLILPESYNGEKYEIHDRFLTSDARVYSLVLPEGYTYTKSNVKKLALVEFGESSMKSAGGLCYYVNEFWERIYILGSEEQPERLSIDESIFGLDGYEIVICNYAFSGDSVKEIELLSPCDILSSSFEGCKRLTRVTAKSGVYIGNSAFRGCTGLSEVDLRGGTVDISIDAFADCTSLSRVNILSEKTELNRSFTGCTSLSDLRLSGKTVISGAPFVSCPSLLSIDLTECEEITSSLFGGDTRVERIYLGDKLRILSPDAFEYLDERTEVRFDGTADAWLAIRSSVIDGAELNLNIRLYVDGRLVTDPEFFYLEPK